jgi:glycosyltransferase involved in cell wall biosynthesis
VKVLVLTTSYPRGPGDPAGRFVADAVTAARASGIEVEVVSPASFRHFGIAYGHGIIGNLKARPWLVLLVPAFFWNFRRAAVRHEADLVHAHWLAAGAVAASLRTPFVVQVWGTDVELARKAPWFARLILRRARVALGASRYLAERARALGAREVRIVPSSVEIPEVVGDPDEPPHVLFVGRLSAEKGIEDFLTATEGLPRVLVGAGPIHVPESVGAVAPSEVGAYYERAAVVCVPSRREGYGMVAREAMAYGRAVVASEVGGLADAIEDQVTGLLVPPGDVMSLRAAVARVSADPEIRASLGAAARERAKELWSKGATATALVGLYEEAALETGSL